MIETVPLENIPFLKISAPDSSEILRFDPNGDIFVKGKLVTNDIEVVDGFRELLRLQAYNGLELNDE